MRTPPSIFSKTNKTKTKMNTITWLILVFLAFWSGFFLSGFIAGARDREQPNDMQENNVQTKSQATE